jgi:hypothetical protein
MDDITDFLEPLILVDMLELSKVFNGSEIFGADISELLIEFKPYYVVVYK